jgi:Tol biopolymer transport system component
MAMKANGTQKREFAEDVLDTPLWLTAAKKRFFLRITGGGFIWRVYTCDPEGRDIRKVFERSCSEIKPPQWSPKGERMAFIVRDEGLYSIFTVGKNGEWPREFFATRDALSTLLWSPKGQHLAFVVTRDKTRTREVWRADEMGLDPVMFYESQGKISNLNWSPDERFLAMEEALRRWPIIPVLYSVIVVDLQQNLARPLLPLKLYARDPAFSPSGDSLAFVSSHYRLLFEAKASIQLALLRR